MLDIAYVAVIAICFGAVLLFSKWCDNEISK